MKTIQTELFPVVTPDGEVVGSATRQQCHDGVSMLLHPVVHLHLVAPDGSIYLQKRVMTKDIQPGKWDTAVGGHVDYGEAVGDALVREAVEELGHRPTDAARRVLTYVFQSARERELVNVFAEPVGRDIQLTPAPDEIDEGRFWTPAEIAEAAVLPEGECPLTPNFVSEYGRISHLLKQLS